MYFLFLFISLLGFTCHCRSDEPPTKIQEGDDRFRAFLFSSAIPFYYQALEEEGRLGNFEKAGEIRCRLAEALFFEERYEEVSSVLKGNLEGKEISPECFLKSLYLHALSSMRNRSYIQAYAAIKKYCELSCEPPIFELALFWFNLGDITSAQIAFTFLQSDAENQKIRWLSGLYLARITLENGQKDRALNLLLSLEKSLCFSDEAREEVCYLKANCTCRKTRFAGSSESCEQDHALLLKAEAAGSFEEKDRFYRQLISETNERNNLHGKGWFLKGLNEFEEGKRISASDRIAQASLFFERASQSLGKAFQVLKSQETETAAQAIKYQAIALASLPLNQGKLRAYALLKEYIGTHPEILDCSEDPDEIIYLAAHLGLTIEENYLEMENLLKDGLQRFPKGKFVDKNLLLLGYTQFKSLKYEEAESTYLRLSNENKESSYVPEALFWAALCSDKLGKDTEISRNRRLAIYQNFPNSCRALEAYFRGYSYREYLQGSKAAIKHLHSFLDKHPETVYSIQAYYLLGLDYKRDRKFPEGKRVAKKNLIAAIDTFLKAEVLYDRLESQIPESEKKDYLAIRYRAAFERGLANYNIAQQSQGPKQKIYLEYAEEVFGQLAHEFENPVKSPLKECLSEEPFSSLYEEICFWEAQAYLKEKDLVSAESIFNKLLERYQTAMVSRGYFLSRVWYEKGKIEQEKDNHLLALEYFGKAEEAGKFLLSTDQRLDLWIQQSLCSERLNQDEKAILLLSKVVNDDAVSSLRLKAMYLRAEMYEKQGRRDIARKQLESMAKKGGEWGLKAKEKLETEKE